MSIFNPRTHEAYIARKQATWEALRDIPKLDLLDIDFLEARYTTKGAWEETKALIEAAQIVIVGGGYFGDEGKGKWGNNIVHLVDAVFRLLSGPNTGRTVYDKEDRKLVLHGIPTAIIEKDRKIPCFVGPRTTNDPISIMEEELAPLAEKGISYDNLKVGNFHVITPYHRIIDVLGSGTNASTCVGMTPVHVSMAAKTGPRLDDLLGAPEKLTERIKRDIQHYRGFLASHDFGRKEVLSLLEERREKNPRIVPGHVLAFAQAHERGNIRTAINYLVELYAEKVVQNELFPQRTDVHDAFRTILKEGKRALIELTQAYFLSSAVEQGYHEGTSADTTAAGALAAAGVNPAIYQRIIFSINKTPGSTRVGRGNIPGSFTDQNRFAEENIWTIEEFGNACVDFDEINTLFFDSVQNNGILQSISYEDQTGKYEIGEALAIASSRKFEEQGATTKKPRIVGLFDCVLGAQLAKAQGPYTFISCMDRGDECEKVGLVVGYAVYLPEDKDFKEDELGQFIDSNGIKYRTGSIIKAGDPVPSSSSEVLRYCAPIIRVMQGWKDTPLRELKQGDEIPKNPCEFVAAIEHYTNLEVRGLGIGPKKEEALFIRKLS